MEKQETILQSLAKIEYIICQLPNDGLSEYLQGIRDMVTLINGEEPNADITSYILKQVVKQEIENELPL